MACLLLAGMGSASVNAATLSTKPQENLVDQKAFDINIGGKMTFDCCTGVNKKKNQYIFTGDFLKDLYSTGTALPTHAQHNMFSINRSRIFVEVERAVEKLKYAFYLVLTGDMNSSRAVREAYLKLEHPDVGLVLLGNTRGPEDRLICGPSNFLVGSGGTDGNFSRFLNATTGCFMVPSSATGDTKESTKICYYTPRICGLQAGVSYTPNTHHFGEAPMNSAQSPLRKPSQPFDLNSFVAGLNYLVAFGNKMTLNLSGAFLWGDTRPEKADQPRLARTNTRSFDGGLVLGIGPVSLGVEYIWNGKSGRLSSDLLAADALYPISPIVDGVTLPAKNYVAKKAGNHWSINTGISYTTKTAGVSLSYFYMHKHTGFVFPSGGKSGRATGRAIALSTEYYLAPGFAPYLEGAIYCMKNPDWAYTAATIAGLTKLEYLGVPSNTARMILAGIKIQF